MPTIKTILTTNKTIPSHINRSNLIAFILNNYSSRMVCHSNFGVNSSNDQHYYNFAKMPVHVSKQAAWRTQSVSTRRFGFLCQRSLGTAVACSQGSLNGIFFDYENNNIVHFRPKASCRRVAVTPPPPASRRSGGGGVTAYMPGKVAAERCRNER